MGDAMTGALQDWMALARRHGQEHVFRWWDELDASQREHLLAQVAQVDFDLLKKLIAEDGPSPRCTLSPAKIIRIPQDKKALAGAEQAMKIGEAALAQGRIAVITVAGGLGTRLGIKVPKGTLPIAPISKKSIFQLHADKIRALQRRYGAKLPWYIMTSDGTDEQTRAYFKRHRFLGLSAKNVCFFRQAWMPVVGLDGKLLMVDKHSLSTSPNGHGGVIRALKDSGCLDDMRRRCVTDVFYFQVDNVLIRLADPVFLGYHLRAQAGMSLKVVAKRDAEEGLGVVGRADGKLRVVEYSDLSKEDKYATNRDGSLKYSMGTIAIHAFSVDFLERQAARDVLPYHRAIKRVSFLGPDGRLVEPKDKNAIKFEKFVFDALPFARRAVVMEVRREDEFSPIKADTGPDSPESARLAMRDQFARWLREAGVAIPTDAQGHAACEIEISPLFALDPDELKRKLHRRRLRVGKRLILS